MTAIKTSAQYHRHTSYDRHNMTSHYLDWQNQPAVFKDYPGIQPIILPPNTLLPEDNLSDILRKNRADQIAESIGIQELSIILRLACTLTAKARHSGGDFYFRSAASAGTLYPTELYVLTREMNGLEDGLYHFAIHRHCLYPLRKEDLAQHVLSLSQTSQDKIPCMTFFLTSIFFRSAWKYRDRAYRYHLLDTGHLTDNLILGLKALDLPFSLTYDFDDALVNQLLGIDPKREIALALVQIPGEDADPGACKTEIADLPESIKNASQVSGKEVDYLPIREMHAASESFVTKSPPEMIEELGLNHGPWNDIMPLSAWPEIMNHSDALYHRRSKRNYVKEPITKDSFTALLEALCVDDAQQGNRESLYSQSIAIGFLVGHAEGMSTGLYLLNAEQSSYSLITEGPFIEEMTHICLDQDWLANAAVHFLFMANLDAIDNTWGPRGYRYAMLTAGRMGQRLYIAATAMGLGCCGIGALYDGEAAELLGLNEDSKLLYLVAVGPVKRA